MLHKPGLKCSSLKPDHKISRLKVAMSYILKAVGVISKVTDTINDNKPENSTYLSPNDLRNSYQVQWWYIHEFYTDRQTPSALLHLVLSIVALNKLRDKHSLLF